VEALALSDRPMTAYRVALSYNLNVAKVYAEMKKLNSLGLVKTSRGRGLEYALADDDLRRLALKLASRVQTYSSWKSDGSRRARFRMGLAAIPPFTLEKVPRGVEPWPRRTPGELENLAKLGRRKFDGKYRRTGERTYARI